MDSTDEIGRRTMLATGICNAAAVAMAIGTFLPMADGSGQSLRANTLIQSGGWPFLPLAFFIALAAVGRHSARNRWAIVVLGAMGAYFAHLLATDHTLLTFYPVDAQNQPQTNLPGRLEDPGIGIWLCGVSSAAAILAAIMTPMPRLTWWGERAPVDPRHVAIGVEVLVALLLLAAIGALLHLETVFLGIGGAVLIFAAFSVCIAKGKIALAFLGGPLTWSIGAFRLAKPESRWARRFYGPEKIEQARTPFAEDHAVTAERDDELLAAWDGMEINPDELDPITRRALKRAGRI
jgi:hypothetical protein